jgi:hypothetical protein
LILLPSFGNKGSRQKIKQEDYWKDSESYVDLGTLQIQTETPFRESRVSLVKCHRLQSSIYFYLMWVLWNIKSKSDRQLKKTFVCPSCHCTMDRDVNGARNVLWKYLIEQMSHSS